MNTNGLHVNQIGYQPDQSKVAVVAGVGPEAALFEVVDEAGRIAFADQLLPHGLDPDSGDTVAHADFTALSRPGRYRLRVAGHGESFPFVIDPAAYHSVLRAAARWFYLQRSGTDKSDAETGFAHRADHTARACLWDLDGIHPELTLDVRGGWWDAGDYGRYVPPAATTLMSLLYAYRFNPGFFRDGSLGLPESGNGQPDLLDELRWELTWLLKMQRGDGGVHHKATCTGFPGEVMPDAATLPVYVYPVSTWATAQFAGALAEASLVFRHGNPAFADRLLHAARQAWRWLAATPQRYPQGGFRNPDHSGGPYSLPERDETEYRLWAAASLLHATGESTYADAFAQLWPRRDTTERAWSLYWWGGCAFAAIAYLDSSAADPAIKEEVRAALLDSCAHILAVANRTGYRVALTGDSGPFGYDWGSNAMTLGYAAQLLLANEFAPDPRLPAAAADQLSYVLGVNPLGQAYFTGAGANPVRHPHHRPSQALGRALPGMVGEGANAMQIGGDQVLQRLFATGVPFARRYADHKDSWATNEPTIYGNAAFVAVAAWLAR